MKRALRLLSVPLIMAPTGIADRSGGTAVQQRIAGGVTAPAAVRELLSDLLEDTTPAETLHDLHLLTTELVTNAVRHAHVDEDATFDLSVVATRAAVRVAITDPGGETAPEMQELNPEVPGGMGLFLVDQISDRWGVEDAGAGATRVWFELAR